ncbi:MAG: Dabb family protein [Oscillospiraceae bacterium]|nr:Dabb family protein [Oscillospiraceae bacterium]
MVKHIVLYTLKENVDKAEAVAIIKAQLEPLVGVIPGLQAMEIRAAYNGVDYALYSEFESKEALTNYATHPAHLAAKEHFWNFLDTRVCADYEV